MTAIYHETDGSLLEICTEDDLAKAMADWESLGYSPTVITPAVRKVQHSACPWQRVDRIMVLSGRPVVTVEHADEPGVFYVSHGRSVSGPFPLDDRRFRRAS